MDVEERQKEEREEKIHLKRLRNKIAEELACKSTHIIQNEERYATMKTHFNLPDTSPGLLDAVVTPIAEEGCTCS